MKACFLSFSSAVKKKIETYDSRRSRVSNQRLRSNHMHVFQSCIHNVELFTDNVYYANVSKRVRGGRERDQTSRI